MFQPDLRRNRIILHYYSDLFLVALARNNTKITIICLQREVVPPLLVGRNYCFQDRSKMSVEDQQICATSQRGITPALLNSSSPHDHKHSLLTQNNIETFSILMPEPLLLLVGTAIFFMNFQSCEKSLRRRTDQNDLCLAHFVSLFKDIIYSLGNISLS